MIIDVSIFKKIKNNSFFILIYGHKWSDQLLILKIMKIGSIPGVSELYFSIGIFYFRCHGGCQVVSRAMSFAHRSKKFPLKNKYRI